MTPATDSSAWRVIPAAPQHLSAIAEAYAGYVATSHVTFDLDPPPLSVWAARLAGLEPVDAFLVAVTAAGEVLGWAYSGPFRPRAAYATTRETTVYTVPGYGGRGLGRALYVPLLAHLDSGPARLAVAAIAEPNDASSRLHAALGFARVGTLVGVGVKFAEVRDVTIWQRPCT